MVSAVPEQMDFLSVPGGLGGRTYTSSLVLAPHTVEFQRMYGPRLPVSYFPAGALGI